jgi:hypothetical protein
MPQSTLICCVNSSFTPKSGACGVQRASAIGAQTSKIIEGGS